MSAGGTGPDDVNLRAAKKNDEKKLPNTKEVRSIEAEGMSNSPGILWAGRSAVLGSCRWKNGKSDP